MYFKGSSIYHLIYSYLVFLFTLKHTVSRISWNREKLLKT